jgi:hypothetical protein
MKYLRVAVLVILLVSAGAASAKRVEPVPSSLAPWSPGRASEASDLKGGRLETLWIYTADFEDLSGDNAGWSSGDLSGTLAVANYWHHDTIRMTGFPHLGDSTWWCGTSNPCWRQPRGYGNNWLQVLERHFTETTGATTSVILEFDQRYAMENDYDYGYVEVRSAATSDTFYAVHFEANPGFAGSPGTSQDWDGTNPEGQGHMVLDLTPYTVGQEFDLRFRFESDGAYSSEDQYNNPPFNSCQDGAWQLDNIELYVDGNPTPVFADDAESGDPWTHEDTPASGQTGVTWWRGRFGIDFVTGRAFTCDDRPFGSWMYAAVDPFTATLVDDEYSYLMSPPIDISGADKLACKFDVWMDFPEPTNDRFNLYLASNDQIACVQDPDYFVDEAPGGWFGGPFWVVATDNWDAFAGNDWLSIMWVTYSIDAPEAPHMAGLFLDRQLVGIPSGDAGTVFNENIWNTHHDWFQEQLADALADSAVVQVSDDDGIVSVFLNASDDGGATWESYPCHKLNPTVPEDEWWVANAPANQIAPGAEVFFYYSSIDGVGNSATFPADAPDVAFEMSILPLQATVSDPGILLVDKHRRLTPGESRNYDHSSQYYYREMLGILGYDWETYEVEVESGSTDQSNGPDSAGYKYYDTQIWFSNEFKTTSLDKPDQVNLVSWLQQAGEGKERNLLVTGNEIGYELIGTAMETMSFYETWLASEYLSDGVGSVLVDSVPGLRDHAGGSDFMTHDDGECILRGACPIIGYFDVVDARPGVAGNEVAVDYVKADASTSPAGVAYTHPTLGYQTVNLGFGMEYMMDSMLPGGYYETGMEDRANLMGNIMDYFGTLPDGPGTGVVSGVRNELSHAHPNPFNPMTRIAYSVKEAGPVTIEVYNVAGRVVRTLLDTEVDAGSAGYVVWDGTSDSGDRCASGVYFYRIAAPGFATSRKMVMLK